MKKKNLLLTAIAIFGLAAVTFGQTVPSYVPTSGLVGWWPFNGNANDESGSGNDGTVNGATLTADRYGVINKAYNFNSSSIRCINPGPLSNSSRTVSFWAKTSSIATAGGYCVSYGSDNVNGGEFGLRLNRNCIGPSIDVSASAITYDYPNSNNNLWHHYVVSYNNIIGSDITSISLYIDGILASTICDNTNASSNNINTTNEEPITFGRWCNLSGFSSIFFDGDLDDIGIWNLALTQQEITDLYNGCQLTVNTQPNNQTININNNAQFIVGSSDPNSTYQWQADLGVGFQNLNSVGQYIGTTNDTLTVSNVTISNNNQPFRCIISTGSCSDTSNVAVLTVNNNVGINEFTQDNLFSVYPNPAHSQINVKSDATLIESFYTVHDNTGKVVLSGKINSENTVIEFGNLSGGIYLFSVGENLMQTFKVIKE
jgi:hypothetical protein